MRNLAQSFGSWVIKAVTTPFTPYLAKISTYQEPDIRRNLSIQAVEVPIVVRNLPQSLGSWVIKETTGILSSTPSNTRRGEHCDASPEQAVILQHKKIPVNARFRQLKNH